MADFGTDQTARESRRDTSSRARRTALSAIMVLFLILLILLLIAAATDRTDILRLVEGLVPTTLAAAGFNPILTSSVFAAESTDKSAPLTVTQGAAVPSPLVSASLRAYYDRCGGERIFGRPISALIAEGPVTYQWYERARLEYDARLAGTSAEVRGGRVGAEYAAGRAFSPAAPGAGSLRFAQTGYSVGGRFRSFWEQNGGVEVLGYPISPELQETLSDGQVHTVQYFERARLELHPQFAGTLYDVQLGLLGRELYRP